MPRGTSINANPYLDTLIKLHKAVKNKRHDMLSQQPIFLHDNAGLNAYVTDITFWKNHASPIQSWHVVLWLFDFWTIENRASRPHVPFRWRSARKRWTMLKVKFGFTQFTISSLKVTVYYARCGAIRKYKDALRTISKTWVYTLFAIRSLPVNKFSVHFQKKCESLLNFLHQCVHHLNRRRFAYN